MKFVFFGLLVLYQPQAQLPSALRMSQVQTRTNPQQIPATQLEQRPLPQLNIPSDVEVRDADLRTVLTALAQAAGLNASIAPDVTGKVTVDLENVTLLQALDAILTPLGLQYEIGGSLLRVARLQMQTRTFSFDYITTQRTVGRSLSTTTVAGGPSTLLTGAETTDLLADIENGLNTLKSENGKIVFHKMSGLIFATDFPRNLDTMQNFLEAVQNVVNRQVVIDARLVEVRLNQESQAGINWPAVLGDSVRVTDENFSQLLTRLSAHGNVNVISRLTVSTLNNQPAVIRLGTQVRSSINEGVVLDVTPQISDDGFITMNMHPAITAPAGQAISPGGDSVPIVDVRETDTVVRVAQGESIVITGLTSNRESNQKTDLVIMLTPRISTVRTALDQTQEGMKPQEKR